MDYEPLDIKDSEKRTEGGPPGWLAFVVIVGAAIVIAVVAFIIASTMM